MTAYDRLDLLFQQNNGIVKTAQVLEIGIAKSTFYAYAKQRGVEQAAHGVYVSPDAWTDAMYLLHLRCAQAVFSHESALFFHDLTDREPNPYSITVKTGYNPASLQADGIKVYTCLLYTSVKPVVGGHVITSFLLILYSILARK